MKIRYLLPPVAFILGASLIGGFYLGILTWAQDWNYAASQFARDRWYVLPIIIGFGLQAAIYSILRFRLFIPSSAASHSGAVMSTSGTTSATAMLACCLHHVTDVLPILGLSAATSFLARYQRPFMVLGLLVNVFGILIMIVVLYRDRQKFLSPQLVLETK